MSCDHVCVGGTGGVAVNRIRGLGNRIRRKYWSLVFVTLAALGILTGCSTRTEQEIKIIDGHKFLCTWTQEPADPFTKNDYRCEAFQG